MERDGAATSQKGDQLENACDNRNGNLVLMTGLPAAGKTTIAEMRYGDTHQFINCDAIKATHPDYDPKNPQDLHAWSQNECEAQMQELFNNPRNAVYDSTGCNAERMVRYIEQAQAAGMTTTVCFVIVSMETSLERNSRRERVVPEAIIRMKAEDITTAYEIVSDYSDESIVIENEWESAEMDDRIA